MEALVTYSNTRLAASIHILRRSGYNITTDYHSDEVGHKYGRYTLKD
jgi:hypothetical protein